MGTHLRHQRESAAQTIARYFPVGTRLSLPPPGGWSLWLELPEGYSSMRLFDDALALGIRTAPGPMFSNADRYDRFVRLSCGMPFMPDVEAAYRDLGRLLQQRG